jgi:hypothetical protein
LNANVWLRYGWLGIPLWILLYITDYTLTLVGARLYHQHAKAHLEFDGSYELTPYFRDDVDAMRRVSPRFLLMLGITTAMLLILWLLSLPVENLSAYVFVLGGMLLLEWVVHARHLRNLLMFRDIATGEAVDGHVTYAHWFSMKTSAVQMFSHMLLFLLIGGITRNWFVLGGAATCASTSIRHWLGYRKARRAHAKPDPNHSSEQEKGENYGTD